MINSNTIITLNDIAFGADIDSLESYIIDYKQASILADLRKYEYNYLKLSKILKEIKSESLAFKDETALTELDNDKSDRLFTTIGNKRIDVAYGVSSNKVKEFKETIRENGNNSDIIAIPYVSGISVNCLYEKGKLYKIHAIGEHYKYIDLTKQLKEKVPNYISKLSEFDLVEFRGKATIFKNVEDRNKYLNTICTTMHYIRTKLNLDKVNIVLDDMFIDGEQNLFNNQWDKIEYMRDLGLSVPHHALIRGISEEIVEQALKELDDYFDDIQNTTGIGYEYSGIEIRINSELICNTSDLRLIYNSKDCDYRQKYKSTIKSITTEYIEDELVSTLNIVSIACNDKLDIDKVEINDIYDIEENQLYIGNKVIFSVVEGKAIVVKTKNI